MARALSDAGVSMAFCVAQTVGRKFTAVIGFLTEEDAAKATKIILELRKQRRRVDNVARDPGRRCAAAGETAYGCRCRTRGVPRPGGRGTPQRFGVHHPVAVSPCCSTSAPWVTGDVVHYFFAGLRSSRMIFVALAGPPP